MAVPFAAPYSLSSAPMPLRKLQGHLSDVAQDALEHRLPGEGPRQVQHHPIPYRISLVTLASTFLRKVATSAFLNSPHSNSARNQLIKSLTGITI